MSVDLSKIKPGDEVTVTLTYEKSSGVGGWQHCRNSAKERLSVHLTDFVSHTPKALQVGDRVRPVPPAPSAMPIEGVIRGIHADRVWVEWEPLSGHDRGDCNSVWRLKSLERLP